MSTSGELNSQLHEVAESHLNSQLHEVAESHVHFSPARAEAVDVDLDTTDGNKNNIASTCEDRDTSVGQNLIDRL